MTSIMRRTVRGTAAGLGALAIVAGTAACGGLLEGDDGGDGPAAEQEDPAEGEGEDGADEEADPAETQQDEAEAEADADGTGETGDDSEGDSAEGDDAAAELTEDDLTAAGDRFYAFLEAMGEGDPDTACSLVIDHETGEPAAGAGLEKCKQSYEEMLGDDFDPSIMSAVEREMIEASDNGDGRAEILALGESTGMFMENVSGEWYIVADSSF